MCTKLHGCTEEVCASNCHCTAHFACQLTWSHSGIAHFTMPCNINCGQNIVMNRMESPLYVLLAIYYVYVSLMLVFIVHFLHARVHCTAQWCVAHRYSQLLSICLKLARRILTHVRLVMSWEATDGRDTSN